MALHKIKNHGPNNVTVRNQLGSIRVLAPGEEWETHPYEISGGTGSARYSVEPVEPPTSQEKNDG